MKKVLLPRDQVANSSLSLKLSMLVRALPGPEVIKLIILNSAEHEIYRAHKC